MKLSEAFDQVEVTLPQAQAIIRSMIANLRDGNPDLHQSIGNDVENMQEPQSSTTTTASKA